MEGRITSIVRQKKDHRRASIFLDEAFAFGVCDQTIEEFRLRKGDYLDRELFDKISAFDFYIEAKRIALHFLNYRARSEKEIRERLQKEEIPDDIILRVIEFLKEQKLVDDEAWSKAFVNDKLVRKPVSSKQLAYGLARKGVPKEVIEQTLASLNEEETDETRAQRAAEKRWPRILRSESDPKKREQKLYTFLASRGFAMQTIRDVYRKIVVGA
ncbi:MAG TPA: RecX family transcriptional regulator, partial [Candidatus Kapabacteria bacterium]